MARRLFFVDAIHSGRAEVAGDDATHLTRVLRVEQGQRYEISDNTGLYLAVVEMARKGHVVFRVEQRVEAEQPVVGIHLLASLIKFDHFEWMLEKATELGVTKITPVIAERSEKGLDRAAPKRLERWRKIVRESAQQSRRWQLPELGGPLPLRIALQQAGARFLLDENRQGPPLLTLLPETREPEDVVSLLVGPEGGWTDSEREQARDAEWQPASLGPAILRAETAAMAALAIVSMAWVAATVPVRRTK